MIIDTVVQPILREELTPADGLPGDLLTDIQIRALPLYQQIIANTNTKHFTAVAKGYHWDVGGIKQKFEENVKNLERVVREHIRERLAAAIPAPAAPHAASSISSVVTAAAATKAVTKASLMKPHTAPFTNFQANSSTATTATQQDTTNASSPKPLSTKASSSKTPAKQRFVWTATYRAGSAQPISATVESCIAGIEGLKLTSSPLSTTTDVTESAVATASASAAPPASFRLADEYRPPLASPFDAKPVAEPAENEDEDAKKEVDDEDLPW